MSAGERRGHRGELSTAKFAAPTFALRSTCMCGARGNIILFMLILSNTSVLLNYMGECLCVMCIKPNDVIPVNDANAFGRGPFVLIICVLKLCRRLLVSLLGSSDGQHSAGFGSQSR